MNSSTELLSSLHQYFGFTGFRPGQAEAIQSLLNGQHTLVVMPTGSGKSLVFQLAGMLLTGFTLVISPLIALMKDQVDSLERRGVRATYINSSLAASEQNRRLKRLAAGEYRIVYVAPERLRHTQFLQAVQKEKVGLLAIDEAHCISEWGHDFRPDYLHIANFRDALDQPLTAALTATATPQVQDDIVRLLNLPDTRRVVTGFNRPNLALEVRYISDLSSRLRALQELLADHRDGAAIIYTGTRRDAEEVAEFVSTVVRVKAQYYHAGLLPEHRTRIQDAFIAGDLSIIAATNAFGMGIDRPDVRQVIHYSLPGSLEAYYQEAGRAGRDELPARAVLLYSPEDRALQEWFIEASTMSKDDLRLLFDAIRPSSDIQEAITVNDLSRLTAMHEVKVRVGLAELERAGILEHQGDEGPRMRLKLSEWNATEIRAAVERVKAHQAHRKTQLEHMIAYAESNLCRRELILKHFGDTGPVEAEICCDNCQARQADAPPPSTVEALTQSERAALIVLDTIRRLKQNVGRDKITLVLKGSKAQEIVKFGYNKNVYYGRLADLSQDKIKQLIDQLCQTGYLKVVGGRYPVLHLTPQGETALKMRSAIPIKQPNQVPVQAPGNKNIQYPENEIDTVIISCVRSIPGKLPRSGVAKLLVGSESERVSFYRNHSLFNKLAKHSRSEVLENIDRLLANGRLAQDEHRYLMIGNDEADEPLLETYAKIDIQHIVALGNAGSPPAVPELITCLRNRNGNIRRLAASALGKIADKRATQPLMDLLNRETKPQVRQYAVKALGQIGDVLAIPLLETIVHNLDEKEYTRESTRIALRRLSSIKSATRFPEKKRQTLPVPPASDPVAAFLSRSHPRQLPGPWNAGWALGFHSAYAGATWNRSETGELTYRLKYQGDLSVLPALVEQALALIAEHPELAQVDAILPVPPSTPRPNDPVSSFAKALTHKLGLAYLPVLVKARQTTPQKEMHTLAQKQANVAGAFDLKSPLKGKRILVIDDLFDSGATLAEIDRLLRRAGAITVCVLTLTRTIHSDA